MIEWIVSSSVLIAALLLLRLLFRNKISKRVQYALWALVLLRLLIPISIVESAASVSNLLSDLTAKPVVQAASGTLTPQVSYDLAVQEVLDAHDYPQEAYSALPEAQQEAIIQEYQPQIQQKLDSYETAYDAAQILKILWLIGAGVMGLFLLVSNFRFYRKLKRTRIRLDSSASLPVYRSPAAQTPCLFGLFRPSIYLPDTAIDEKAMSYILAHEQTHRRHLDHIWALARCICLALHWYNPLVWIAVKVSRTDSELACDEGTLAKLGDDCRESYGRTLIEMSCARPSMADYLLTSTTMTGDKKSLYQRIQAIATKQKVILAAVICLAVAVLILVGCTFTGAGSKDPDPDTPPAENIIPEEPAGPSADTPPESTADPEPSLPTFPMGDTGAATDGALRSLPLDIGSYCNSYIWGDTLLFYNANRCQVRSLQDGSLLTSTYGVISNSATVTDEWIIGYVLTTQQIVFRDKNLEVVKTVDVDVGDDVSEMLFSQDGSKAYYHIYPSNTIVELNIQTGEKREIPVDGAPIWILSALEFEDSVLRYWGREDHQNYYAFVDLSSGEYLGKDTQMTKLQTWDNGYYLCRAGADKTEHRIVIESTERYIEPQKHENLYYNTWALPQVNGLFALHSSPESSTVILELYDLTTGECTNSLTANLGQPYQHSAEVFADPSGEYIWLCLKIGPTSNYQMVLYRWDFQANAVTE